MFFKSKSTFILWVKMVLLLSLEDIFIIDNLVKNRCSFSQINWSLDFSITNIHPNTSTEKTLNICYFGFLTSYSEPMFLWMTLMRFRNLHVRRLYKRRLMLCLTSIKMMWDIKLTDIYKNYYQQKKFNNFIRDHRYLREFYKNYHHLQEFLKLCSFTEVFIESIGLKSLENTPYYVILCFSVNFD